MSKHRADASPSDLRDPLWRLRNLYSCRKEGVGVAMPFEPRAEQEVLFRHLIESPTKPIYVIKSRRLGMSTAIDTFMCDQSVFTQGFRGVIIDQKQADATKKMVEIVRFAFDSLPNPVKHRFIVDKRNDSEMRIRLKGEPESQDSVVFATTGSRGGDCSMLHVSEWGPIAATDPARSNEIRTGAFPSARLGRRVVETTWYGGKGGDLWELIKPLMERDPNAEGVLYFFPWHQDPQAIKLDGMVTDEVEHYFRELAGKVGRTFTQEQKKWYAAKRLEQGIFVKREYPSTLDEAFAAPVQGSIYGPVLDELRAAGRIRQFEWDRGLPVVATWDLGWNDTAVVWLIQIDGPEIRWLHHIGLRHKTAAEMHVEVVKTGIPVIGHLIPHDGNNVTGAAGTSYRVELEKAGAQHVQVVPRSHSIWPGINVLRNLLRKSWFRVPACEEGINALGYYHTKEVTSGGAIAEEPVHDASSHHADAARTFAEAYELGMIRTLMRKSPRPTYANIEPGEPVDVASVRRGNRASAISGGFRL